MDRRANQRFRCQAQPLVDDATRARSFRSPERRQHQDVLLRLPPNKPMDPAAPEARRLIGNALGRRPGCVATSASARRSSRARELEVQTRSLPLWPVSTGTNPLDTEERTRTLRAVDVGGTTTMANDTEPKAIVKLSPYLDDEDCRREADAHRRRWETGLRKLLPLANDFLRVGGNELSQFHAHLPV